MIKQKAPFPQLFASNLDDRARDLRFQQKKQLKLIRKILPKPIMDRFRLGEEVVDTIDCASVYFCSVLDFPTITSVCTGLQVRS